MSAAVDSMNTWSPQVTEQTRADVTATKTLFNQTLSSGWNNVFTVPSKKSYIVTNVWAHSEHGSAVVLKFEHTYQDGSAVIYWGLELDPADPNGTNHHTEGAKVFEAGSVLRINCSVAAVVGITLDGTEVSQT